MATFAVSASLRVRRILRRECIDGMIAFFSIPWGPIAWWGARGTGVLVNDDLFPAVTTI